MYMHVYIINVCRYLHLFKHLTILHFIFFSNKLIETHGASTAIYVHMYVYVLYTCSCLTLSHALAMNLAAPELPIGVMTFDSCGKISIFVF